MCVCVPGGGGRGIEAECVFVFQVEEAVAVDGEVAEILSRSRFSDAFTVQRGAPAPPGVAAPRVSTELSGEVPVPSSPS